MKAKLVIDKKDYLVEFKSNNQFIDFMTHFNNKISSVQMLNEDKLPELEKPVEVAKPSTSDGWGEVEQTIFKDIEAKPSKKEPSKKDSLEDFKEFKYEEDESEEKESDKEEKAEVKEKTKKEKPSKDEEDYKKEIDEVLLAAGIEIKEGFRDNNNIIDEEIANQLKEMLVDEDGSIMYDDGTEEGHYDLLNAVEDALRELGEDDTIETTMAYANWLTDNVRTPADLEEGFRDNIKKAVAGVAVAGSLFASNPALAKEYHNQLPTDADVVEYFEDGSVQDKFGNVWDKVEWEELKKGIDPFADNTEKRPEEKTKKENMKHPRNNDPYADGAQRGFDSVNREVYKGHKLNDLKKGLPYHE